MSEKIKIFDLNLQGEDGFLSWFVVHGIAGLAPSSESYNKIAATAIANKGEHTVSLTVDGVELPVVQTFRDLNKQDERRIAEKAAELLEAKLGDKLMPIEDLLEALRKEILRTAKKDLGIQLDEES
jgi:hypothetical protein